MAVPEFSVGISVMPCSRPGCTCGCVIVPIHDDAGQSSADIMLPRPMAEAFLSQFSAVLGRVCGRELSPLAPICCEVTA